MTTPIQPKKGDTVNIQLYAATFNNNKIYDYISSNKKFNTLTCTNSNNEYSIWTCDFKIETITNPNVNCNILFNTVHKTFHTINNTYELATYEIANLSFKKTISIDTYTVGSFWSGNGQTNQGEKGSFIGNNVLAHTWHTLYIQKSKFDSYFGVPSSILDFPDVDYGLI